MGSTSIRPDGINAISVADHHLESAGFVQDSDAEASVPVSRLFQASEIIYNCSGQGSIEIPALLLIQRDNVIEAEQPEILCADLLIIITGQGKGILRDHRQHGPEAIGAETVSLHARASGQTDINAVFPFRKRIRQQCRSPKKV